MKIKPDLAKISPELWQIADELRRSPTGVGLGAIVTIARERAVIFDLAHLRQFEPLLVSQGQCATPSTLIDLCTEFARIQKPTTILDPWAGYGALVLPITDEVRPEQVVAISPENSSVDIGAQLSVGLNVTWLAGDPLSILSGQVDKAFDLIVSCPPFNYQPHSETLNVAGTIVKDDYGNRIVAAAINKLSTHGYAMIVLSPATVLGSKPSGLMSSLQSLGLSLNGLLHLRSGFFAKTTIESYVAIISRVASERLFIGAVRDQKIHNDLLMKNFCSSKNGADLSLGLLVDPKDFAGYRQFETAIATKNLARRTGLTSIALNDIAIEINLTKERNAEAFPDRDNAVYLPLIGKSKALSAKADLTMNAHNYAQIVLDGNRALAPYVASYFNSPLGQLGREQIHSGTFIPKITKSSLNAAVAYLPELEMQRHCIELDSRAVNLISEVQSIRDALWSRPKSVKDVDASLDRVNREDSFKSWIDGLPFPLASILWTYHASGEDDAKRVEHLLHFFEALAEFTALVLWSAVKASPSLLSHTQYPLGNDKPLSYPLQHSSFGSWIEMGARLAKFTRQRLADQADSQAIVEAFHTDSIDALSMLTSTKIVGLLNSANGIRNNQAHGGIVGRQAASINRAVLENLLAIFRQVVGNNWEELPLMKAGGNRLRNGIFHYGVELIMGRSYPFEKVNVELTMPIDDGGLFLLPTGSREPIILEPLMLVSASPQGAENACYFYNSSRGQELRYVSYHFDGQPEIIKVDERVSAALAALAPSN